MKLRLLLSLLPALLLVGRVLAAPVEPAAMTPGSCKDPHALGAAKQALAKINQDRREGYVFGLHRLSNVHMARHGETGVVYYLTLDVVETNCSVLSRRSAAQCETRQLAATPKYGQCKAAIYMNLVHRVVRLYKYDCVVRPVSASKVHRVCPDCPSHVSFDNEQIQRTVTQSLAKFNQENQLANHFALLSITRATSSMGVGMIYNVEYTIQETTCTKSAEGVVAVKCPVMKCEFAHKGFCKASFVNSPVADFHMSVDCEIYEPEAAEREKKLHVLGDELDHSHNDTHTHTHAHEHDQSHDHTHGSAHRHAHDHAHDHTGAHEHNQGHAHDDHHHTHDHTHGSIHRHAHDHSHDHGHNHDHVHAHHAQAHDHSGDGPNHHHGYTHAAGQFTHEHDHELALDHDHKHTHLHAHEHHHHHHEHHHETAPHDDPQGSVRVLPAMGQAVTLPSFPDQPAAGPEQGVTLPLKPDPQVPGQTEPAIAAFPAALSADCPVPTAAEDMMEEVFANDPLFRPSA